ncbi:carbohydrate ABC transporter permease [Paenibacillus pasadenensis]|uniref:carbohydrate ABC transporter permease n=1 Tax=Paenibacillus pasadenensis TaxID=217090 RepID=UPI00203FC3AB|nr:carbohydrate ABC transporter permease [Paenibacillus pasadenensis]MCM3747023.1 carbohydrate ABC transporter permease [Paenibacillus pasadenensis]
MRTKSPRYAMLEIGLIALAVLFMIPLYFVVSMTFKSPEEMAGFPLSLPGSLSFGNYAETWAMMRFPLVFANTLLITVSTVALLIIFGSMAAYPLARKSSKTYNFLYIYFIAGIMVPFQLAMVPLYRFVNALSLVNTYHGAILIYTAINLPLTVFLFTGFLKSTSRELEEAAWIDGCSKFRAYWVAVFPIIKPATATVAVLCSLSTWNDFLIPLLFLQDSSRRTITIELYMFVGEHVTNWSLLFPGMVLSVLPLLLVYLFLQKYIIKGIAAGSVKG